MVLVNIQTKTAVSPLITGLCQLAICVKGTLMRNIFPLVEPYNIVDLSFPFPFQTVILLKPSKCEKITNSYRQKNHTEFKIITHIV